MLRYRGPEVITYAENEREPERFRLLLDTHWMRNEEWIQAEGEKLGFAWVIVCGMEIVAGGTDMKDFPDDDTKESFGRATGLVPFAYSLMPVVSEPTLGNLPTR
jgi:hypothetical protein